VQSTFTAFLITDHRLHHVTASIAFTSDHHAAAFIQPLPLSTFSRAMIFSSLLMSAADYYAIISPDDFYFFSLAPSAIAPRRFASASAAARHSFFTISAFSFDFRR